MKTYKGTFVKEYSFRDFEFAIRDYEEEYDDKTLRMLWTLYFHETLFVIDEIFIVEDIQCAIIGDKT